MVHVLGTFGAPRFRIAEPWSPDEAWELEHIANAPGIRGSISSEIELSYMAFAEGTAAENGAHVLGALPDGAYSLVRTAPPAERGKTMLLGNAWVPAPPNAVVWGREAKRDGLERYAVAFGRSEGAPPTYKTPYVCLGILNFTGYATPPALLAFELGDPGTVSQLAPASKDAIFIVPEAPPFVIDAMAKFSAERSAADLAGWRKTEAAAFIEDLTRWP